MLERVAELGAERLSDIVQEALELAVLTQLNPRRYRFAHPLIREALYQYPPAAERIRLHRKIGETLEQLHPSGPEAHLAALAHHFRESSIADKAIDYSFRAGEAAEAVFAYDDALSHLRSALPIAEADGLITIRSGRESCFVLVASKFSSRIAIKVWSTWRLL